jgi:hypothetical protein
MSERTEKLMRDYPRLVMERTCLENQLANFKGVTEAELIDSMLYSRPQGDRVQTTGVSDKTAHIAITYRDKMDRINSDWKNYLARKLTVISDEIEFFEAALKSLSGNLPEIMTDMIIARMTWDAMAEKYYVSRAMIGKYRKKAILELDVLFANHDKEISDFILN